jgi:hypothetical protein
MSLFEEYLTLGQWLTEEERLALYKYLLKTKKVKYSKDYNKLLTQKTLKNTFANGEIIYSLGLDSISYKARKLGEIEYSSEIRTIPLSKFTFLNRLRTQKFFAQCEVDVIRNFPVPSDKILEERSIGINVFPFYDLNYYSNGSGKAKGLLKRIQSKDDELLGRLLAS